MRKSENTFIPIRGTEAKILAEQPIKGAVYFATDTKKIFYSNGEEFLSMGGNSSIFYGKKDTSDSDSGQINFVFSEEDLENQINLPQPDDLILNTDGCFYRVVEVSPSREIETVKLTIAGSGGGGGTGGPITNNGTASVTFLDPTPQEAQNIILLQNGNYTIKFNMEAKDADENPTGPGTVSWKKYRGLNTNIAIPLETLTVNQGENEVDVTEMLKGESGPIRLQGVFKLWTGGEAPIEVRKSWTFNIIKLDLKWSPSLNYAETESIYDLRWTAISEPANLEKTTHIFVNNGINIDEIKYSSIANGEQRKTISRADYLLDHTVAKISMYMSVSIDGKIYKTDTISNEVIFANPEEKTPLIAFGNYEEDMLQYNTQQIPIVIYNADGKNASLYDGDTLIDSWNDLNSSIRYWSFTPTTPGEHQLKISCDTEQRIVLIQVKSVEIDNEEVSGYTFRLKANEISSNDALKNWSFNGHKLEFSQNFDWINGGIKSELDEKGNSRPYICIKSGTTMTIDYKLFESFDNTRGKNFKVIFKTVNGGNFDAEFLKCVDENENGNGGLVMRAQDANYSSAADSIKTQYCENSYIDYELDIYPPTINKNYIISWVDGVPAGIVLYSNNTFYHKQPTKIVIGSEDCDVYLYLFRVYEKYIPMKDHLKNFIADAPNALEMISRYNRNNILDDYGEISWEALVEKNPDCQVHLYELPEAKVEKNEDGTEQIIAGGMTTSKKDKRKVVEYKLYKGTSVQPSMYAGDLYGKPCVIKVQGTSSQKYGISAFNLDTEFKKGMFDGEGNSIDGYSLDNNSIPEKYFTTKVNVASCEGANNALNQLWYQTYQPYICKARKADSRKRDTMNFKPGVIFIKDNNKETNGAVNNPAVGFIADNVFKDTVGYIEKPYYKLYSICNFGNSKKNLNTLHNINNPHEVCIENTDNQSPGQWMVRADGYNTTTKEFVDLTNEEILDENGQPNANYELWINALNDKNFDVRYQNGTDGVIDDNGNVMDQQKVVGFFNLVKWMAQSDPSPYDAVNHPHGYKIDTEFTADTPNAILNESTGKYEVTFDSYTFRKKDWKGDDTLLGGTTIQTYKGTYTHDCYEYRMAKMLSECEDHLIMDSIVFHYLFIERHSLIDNVAKNTFWTSEDENNQYWSLIKDYDNDTADGNDNSGRLTLTYGKEVDDAIFAEVFDEASNSNKLIKVPIFNAYESVWLHFILGLEDARRVMYQKLEEKGAWNSVQYLNAFENWQNSIPECCWIEDYYRKYIRPYEVYNSLEYFEKLEGGKKTHQRRQYETYQEIYLGTKYRTAKYINTANSIGFRGNAEFTPETIKSVPIKTYSDCYVNAQWAQSITSVRAKKGEVVELYPYNLNMKDETDYLFTPNVYSSIGDMGVFEPKTLDITSADRLQEFNIENAKILTTINFKGSKLLKKLTVKNCKALGSSINNPSEDSSGQSLDLSSQVSLKELDLTGSSIQSLTLPDNAPLRSIKLPKKLSSLVINNLYSLEEVLVENDEKNINQLIINNLDNSIINSLELLNKTVNLNNDFDYGLKNIKWKLSSLNDIDLENKNIKILDILLNKNPVKFVKTKNEKDEDIQYIEKCGRDESLTGQILISRDLYSANDSVEIYNKYVNADAFPNLDIQFEDENAKLISVKILNGNGEVYWTRRSNATAITEEFLSEGPKGAFNVSGIKKDPTIQYKYEFTNKWKLINSNGDLIAELTPIDGIPLYNEALSEDVTLIPIFNQSNKTYDINFYDANGENPTTMTANAVIDTLNDVVLRFFSEYGITTKEDVEDLTLKEVYAFEGYSEEKEFDDEFVNLGQKITRSFNLYPKFKKTNVYNNVLRDYLSISSEGLLSVQQIDGKQIQLKGKITLPLTLNGIDVTGIAENGFKSQNLITHIFWEKGNSKVEKLNNYSFKECETLRHFEMIDSIKIIGEEAFHFCRFLFADTPDEEITNYFKNLTQIESYGFYFAGYRVNMAEKVISVNFGGNLTRLGDQVFLNSIGISTITFGDSQNPSKLNGSSALGIDIFNNGLHVMDQKLTVYVDSNTKEYWTNEEEKKAILTKLSLHIPEVSIVEVNSI